MLPSRYPLLRPPWSGWNGGLPLALTKDVPAMRRLTRNKNASAELFAPHVFRVNHRSERHNDDDDDDVIDFPYMYPSPFSFGGLSQDHADIRGPLGLHGYHTLFACHVVVMSCHVTSCHVMFSLVSSFASHHTSCSPHYFSLTDCLTISNITYR